MTDFVNLVMLVAASIGSMAFGILAAYAVLRGGFALMRPAGKPLGLSGRPRVVPVEREVELGG
jgi:hypothetical protein